MKQLANQCARTDKSVTFSKFEVAQHQLDAATYNLFLGNWPASITLAGAAEEVLPRPIGRDDLFAFLQKRVGLDESIDAKAIGNKLNELRNWSKHFNAPADQQFSQGDSVSMILRAHSRLYFQETAPDNENYSTAAQEVFVEWFKVHYRDWLEPKNNSGKAA